MSENSTESNDRSPRARLRDVARPGVIGSIVLHAAVLGLLLYAVGVPPVLIPVIPVELVPIFEQTASQSPSPDAKAALPSAGSPRQLASVAPPRAAREAAPRPRPVPAPPATLPSAELPAPDALPPVPSDPLRSQLDALAKLRMPSNSGAGSRSTGSNAPAGPQSGYRVEDLIRAQIQRRWNLRLDELGERDLIVTIHIVIEPDGTVSLAEIVDTTRGKSDETYRSIALSARNAVLLSSPLTLPVGLTAEMRDMTLSFNTRDSLR
jgi:hypothetical protein